MPEESNVVELADLGVLSVRGADAVQFLQGQLSSDVTQLPAEGAQLCGYHNPQGRVIAVLRLLQAEAQILAVLPRELIPQVLARLGRFVLRAKVQLRDASADWRVRGSVQPSAPGGIAFAMGGATSRWLALAPQAAPRPAAASLDAPAEPRSAWTLLDIASGLPQVYAPTSEAFVAQMLNLDLVNGVAFSKGCYTGQEVIARAHYRGRVKRRMQRFRTRGRTALAPGASGRLADGRSYRVVEAAQLPDGRCEFLAVAPLEVRAESDGEPEPAAGAPLEQAPLEVESLPLPYELPR